MASAKLLALFHLSVLFLTSFSALAYNEAVSFAQAPHYTHPSHPPAEAPKPDHHHIPGHHHKGGHHHHHHPKPPTQPPMKPPTPPTKPPMPAPPAKAPVHPPVKAPTPPPKAPTPPPKAPTPPPKAPTPPPAKAPTPPPAKAPTPPPAKAPTPPPAKAPTPPPKAPTPPPKSPTPPPKAPTPPPKAPTPPPKTPTPPPKAPTPPPKYPPMPPMVKKLVAIQGVVFCKSCKYTGVDTLTGATALANATVKLVCARGKFHMVHLAKTDKNGYFYMAPPKLTTAEIGICKVFLAKSSSAKCSVPTKLNNGLKGAVLAPPHPPPMKTPTTSKFALFTVGPFAYEAFKKCY